MEKIDRRQLLKAAAAAGAGAAAASIPALAPTSVLAAGSSSASGQQPRSNPAVVLPNTAGVTYETAAGYLFHPVGSATTYTFVSPDGISWGGAGDSAFWYGVKPPNSALITETSFVVANPNGLSFTLLLTALDASPNQTHVASATYTTATMGPTIFTANPGSPVLVDTTSTQYVPAFVATDSTQVLYAARVGWVGGSDLATFPNPRRVYHQAAGTVTTAEAFILNIDATTKAAAQGGGPSGVPATAKSAFCAVQSYEAGVMTLYPAGTPDTGTANWSVAGTNGTLQMLYMLVPLGTGANAGKFNIHNRFTDKEIYVDVWGYLS